MNRRLPWRWRLAYFLNRSRHWCWAGLVGWVMRNGDPLLESRDVSRCDSRNADTVRNGACYCGKFKAES